MNNDEYTYDSLYNLLGGHQYFSMEQLKYMTIKLNNPKSNSLYLESVLHNDMKKINRSVSSDKSNWCNIPSEK